MNQTAFASALLGSARISELGEAGADATKHWFSFTNTDLAPPIGRQFAGSILDVVQLPDPLQDLVCIPR
jgi:hypothetical protein